MRSTMRASRRMRGSPDRSGRRGLKSGIGGGVTLRGGGGTGDVAEMDKRAHCVDMLSEGFVQSFVDFFYLSHRPPLPPIEDGGWGPKEKHRVSVQSSLRAEFELSALEGVEEEEEEEGPPAGGGGGGDGEGGLEELVLVQDPTSASARNLRNKGPDGFVHMDSADAWSLRAELCAAEQARRRGDLPQMLHKITALAKHYFMSCDARTAAFFLSRALDTAQAAGDGGAELACARGLGEAHRVLGDLGTAASFFTRVAEAAGSAGRIGDAQRAKKMLAKVLEARGDEKFRQALQLQTQEANAGRSTTEVATTATTNPTTTPTPTTSSSSSSSSSSSDQTRALAAQAATLFLQAANEAAAVGASQLQARARLQAGRACVLAGRGEDAVAHLRAFLQGARERMGEAVRQLGGEGGVGEEEGDPDLAVRRLELLRRRLRVAQRMLGMGYGALAQAYEATGKVSAAVSALREFLGDAVTEADGGDAGVLAAMQAALAALLSRHGEPQGAEKAMRAAFELQRSSVADTASGTPLVDRARAELGVALGAAKEQALFHAVSKDIAALLAWKTNRDPTALRDPKPAKHHHHHRHQHHHRRK